LRFELLTQGRYNSAGARRPERPAHKHSASGEDRRAIRERGRKRRR
jgi:hypothetical protein